VAGEGGAEKAGSAKKSRRARRKEAAQEASA
jgi:hypothetical protein